MISENLSKQASELPSTPGVYRFNDKRGKPLYIGKAKKIKQRVRQHLSAPHREGLIDGAEDIEIYQTQTENQARQLERALIIKHRPKRNIALPSKLLYLSITDEPYPRLTLTRDTIAPAGLISFGPFENSRMARRLAELLEKTFFLRTCLGEAPGRAQSPCLDYYLGRCKAPCVDKISQQDYNENVRRALSVLRGNHKQLSLEIEKKMKHLSEERLYEEAALLRDDLLSLNKIAPRAKSTGAPDCDVVAIARKGDEAILELRKVRGKEVVDISRTFLHADRNLPDGEIIRQFIETNSGETHQTILVSELVAIEDKNVKVPQRGTGKEVLDMAKISSSREIRRPAREKKANPLKDLEELTQFLKLDYLPLQIACVDISNIGEKQTVGAVVSFTAGEKSGTKTWLLEKRDKPNDVKAIGETLTLYQQLGVRPDLLIVDGGRGQLNRAARVLSQWVEVGVVIVGLAKKEELVHIIGKKEPLRPEKRALRILTMIRDQTHQAAISSHRKERERAAFATSLDNIKGLGPVRKQALLDRFGSFDKVIAATEQELSLVVPPSVAKLIKERQAKKSGASIRVLPATLKIENFGPDSK